MAMTKRQYKALVYQGVVKVQPTMDADSHKVRHTVEPETPTVKRVNWIDLHTGKAHDVKAHGTGYVDLNKEAK